MLRSSVVTVDDLVDVADHAGLLGAYSGILRERAGRSFHPWNLRSRRGGAHRVTRPFTGPQTQADGGLFVAFSH
jgi:hypothetical protein